jgi:hypothetical protein
MPERRSEDRKYLTYFSRVIDRKTGRLVGYMADLTTGGALLIADRELPIDTLLHLRMDLPDGFANKSELSFNAKVIWNRPDDDPDFYKTGLKLSEIDFEDLAIIQRVLNEYGFRI